MFMDIVRSEVFGAQQGREHVDRHADGGGDVEDGDDHGSHAPEQDGVDGEQREHRRACRDKDEIHKISSGLWSRPYIAPPHKGSAPMDEPRHKRKIKITTSLRWSPSRTDRSTC
jgi:hypothetical protein